MTRNNTSSINKETQVNRQKLETVTGFKFLGSVVSDEVSKPETLSRTAQTTTALTSLKPVWNDRSIYLSSKIRLMHSLVTSSSMLVKLWTHTEKPQRRIRAMEKRCYRSVLCISYKDHVTNKEVCDKIQQTIGPNGDLLIMVRIRKLKWYEHVSRSAGPAKIVLKGTVKGGRRQGRQKKRWEDFRKWTGLKFVKSKRAVEKEINGGNRL